MVDFRQVAGPHEHVAAARIDLILERERDRLRGERLVQFAVECHDRLHAALLPRGERHHFITPSDDARCDRAGKAAEVQVGTQHQLHRKPEVLHVAVGADVDGLEQRHQRRARVPGHVGAVDDDVVALQRRERHEVHVGELEPRGEVDVIRLDPFEDRLVVVDDVHLVDGDDDVLDAQQRHDEHQHRQPRRIAQRGTTAEGAREHREQTVRQEEHYGGERRQHQYRAPHMIEHVVAYLVGGDRPDLIQRGTLERHIRNRNTC